jgi:hypothetical protein
MWFGSRAHINWSKGFSAAEHLGAVKKALEKIDTIKNVEVPEDTIAIRASSWTEEEDERFFPIYSNGTITFSLFLPKRVQADLIGWRDCYCSAEQIQVTIIYRHSLPVAYISYDLDDQFANTAMEGPSDAVIVVRKYLQKMLADDEKITFEFLGPSPMHVDVFLKSGAELGQKAEFKDLSQKGRGYKRFIFTLPALNSMATFREFVHEHHDVLSAYYRIVRHRNQLMKQFVSIHNAVASLLPDTNKGKLVNRIQLISKVGRTVESILETLLRNQLTTFELKKYVAESKSDGVMKDDSPFIPLIQRELNDDHRIPSEEIRDIIRLYEERRLRLFEVVALLISAIIGGVIGSLVTMSVSH